MQITRGCKTSISTRGRYFAPEEKEVFLKANPDLSRVPSTDRPLYLLVQVESSVIYWGVRSYINWMLIEYEPDCSFR